MESNKKNPSETSKSKDSDSSQKPKASDNRNRIINFIKTNGPSLPVQIAKELQISSLFAGAFLSELSSDKTIKISRMKVGGSPLYFLPDQKLQLENFSNYLPEREKEAFLLLKGKKLLQDNQQDPVIRVALRNLKDFAIPIAPIIKNERIIFWYFYSLLEKDAKLMIENVLKEEKEMRERIEHLAPKLPLQEKKIGEKIMEGIRKEKLEIKTPEEKFDDVTKKKTLMEPIFDSAKKPKPVKDKFLNEIQVFITQKSIELLGIESFEKKQVTAKIRFPGEQPCLLLALDKKKPSEKDLLKAYKKALALKIPYCILTRGDASKKMKESIEIYKNLLRIEKL